MKSEITEKWLVSAFVKKSQIIDSAMKNVDDVIDLKILHKFHQLYTQILSLHFWPASKEWLIQVKFYFLILI